MADRICSDPDCDRIAHARGMCSAHYHAFRRANPDAPVRTRVSPNATLPDRIAAHINWENGHALWTGFLTSGVPGLVTNGHKPQRHIENVRHLQLAAAGYPRPPGRWVAQTTCGIDRCVHPDHLQWDNRRIDAHIPTPVVDDLITRHAAGTLNVANAADELGVCRQTVYKAMKRRGYAFTT